MGANGEGQALGCAAVRCGQSVGRGVSEEDRGGSFRESYILPKKGACEVERGDAKYAIMILGEFEVREFACLLVCLLKCFDHFSRQTYFVYGLHRNRAF